MDMEYHQHMMSALSGIIKGLAQLMGSDTEVVLHDLCSRQVCAIENAHITGRAPGYQFDEAVYDTFINAADDDGLIVGYGSKSLLGRDLRSSHLLVRDDNGEPCALICVNQDITKLKNLRDSIDELIRTRSLHERPQPASENPIQDVTRRIILEAVEQAKPLKLDTKEGKLKVLRELSAKGVFDVRDSIPQVCGILSVSQATLYNYLKEIRGQSGSGEM